MDGNRNASCDEDEVERDGRDVGHIGYDRSGTTTIEEMEHC
jgi:predicted alpha/beta hydrolase